MLKLTNLAILKCLRHINQITDIGTLPYHLVKPILAKMTAKQLEQVESNSPHIKPYSDELWLDLIKKDFPNRPIRSKTINTKMVNKTIYETYAKQQEDFRKDSTERLKQMTQILQYKKSANSVIEVEQILRDPIVKPYRGNKNSILNKARKECENRSLMFGGKKSLIRPVKVGTSVLKSAMVPKVPPKRSSLRVSELKSPVTVTESKPPFRVTEKSPLRITKPYKSSAFIQRKPRVQRERRMATKQEEKTDIKPIKSSVFHRT